MKYRDFIEDNFLIDDMDTGAMIPFKFRDVQNKYYDTLCQTYNEGAHFSGLRELILKARKEGFTSLILALFCADIILNPNGVRYLEISYKDDATSQHYRRAKGYIMSFYRKVAMRTGKYTNDKALEKQIFSSINDGHEFIMAHNGASFYVGTASVKTGERGSNVHGVLFTEMAFYPNTDIIKASEIIEGTRSMVPVGMGMIFGESTANGYNHFFETWTKAVNREVDYYPRFFSWREFYTQEQFEIICKGFTRKELIAQEFPDNPEAAFLTSGYPVFDVTKLSNYRKNPNMIQACRYQGEMVGVRSPTFEANPNGRLKIWKLPERTKEYVIGADPSEGVAGGDYACAQVLEKSTWEQVAVLHGRFEADIFAKELYKLGIFYNEALLMPERNSMGVAVVITLRDLFYPNLYLKPKLAGDVDNSMTQELGWRTDAKTKAQLISDGQEAIRNQLVSIHDEDTLQELFSFSYDESGNARAAGNGKDDRVMSILIAIKGCKDMPSTRKDSNSIMGQTQFGVNDLASNDTSAEEEYF